MYDDDTLYDVWADLYEGADPPTLGELLDRYRPRWHRDALCAEPGYTLEGFFPARGEPIGPAVAVCARCLVRRDCLQDALNAGASLAGIWGGTTPRARRQARQNGLTADDLIGHHQDDADAA